MGGVMRHLLMPQALKTIIVMLHPREMTLLLLTEGPTDGDVVGHGEI